MSEDKHSEGENVELPTSLYAEYRHLLAQCFVAAMHCIQEKDALQVLLDAIGHELAAKVRQLAQTKHAARGALLTLAVYKAYRPEQDIRHTKAESPDGFSARSFDTRVTVPFLLEQSLPRNVETHWLSQTLSFAGSWDRTLDMKTQPKRAGILLIDVVNSIEERYKALQESEDDRYLARNIAILLLADLILIRNKGQVLLTRPKNLTIEQVVDVLGRHFTCKYATNAPRLPQLAIYAIYQCLVGTIGRYREFRLEPLARMKSADRKAGTVGDIVLSINGRPAEAVETKLGKPISLIEVSEAIEKIRAATVERYFILSTAGVVEDQATDIRRLCGGFRASNGCEIIVNGVLETISYYLRLLPSPYDFILAYTNILENDEDLDYEHRIAWNEICAVFAGL